VLTKRPSGCATCSTPTTARSAAAASSASTSRQAEPLPNLWLGVSIENRRFVGRADLLRDTPAAVRFISAEPLLGPLLFKQVGGRTPKAGGRELDGRTWDELPARARREAVAA
jgi:protein gp37